MPPTQLVPSFSRPDTVTAVKAMQLTQQLFLRQHIEQLPVTGSLGTCRHHWLSRLAETALSSPDDTSTQHDDETGYDSLAAYLVRVQPVMVPGSFSVLLQETPTPVALPLIWTVAATADTHDKTVGGLALLHTDCPPLWPGYAHPDWLWTPAGLIWLLWQAVTQPAHTQTALAKASVIYDWLVTKGYAYLLLENGLKQVSQSLGVETPKPTLSLIPPAECPLSRTDWQLSQAMVSTLQHGLVISASAAPHTHSIFGAVAQQPNNPWTIVHTGSLWFLDAWLHQPDGWLDRVPTVNNLLRQSIDTVVLHRMLMTDVTGKDASL